MRIQKSPDTCGRGLILGSIVTILLSNVSCLEFVYFSFIYHDFWNYKVWNLFAFYLNSNRQNFFILTKIICQTPYFFLFCFKWAVVIMMMITLFTSQTSSLAKVLKLIEETYYAISILIFGSWITFRSSVVNQCCCCCCCCPDFRNRPT